MILLSVVISTRNRPLMLERCFAALSESDMHDFELLIVDQGEDHQSTKEIILKYNNSFESIRHIPCADRGLSHAKNHGAAHAQANIIAFTDDDCLVNKDWVRTIIEFFNSHSAAVVLYGSVIPAPYNLEQGRTAGGKRKDQVLQGIFNMIRHDGTGGNMAIKKTYFNYLNGFDEVLTNNYFGAEDWDFAYRTLSFNFPIHHSSKVILTHEGFKLWAEAQPTLKRYEQGTAALFTKYLRCCDLRSMWIWLYTFARKLKIIYVTGNALKKRSIIKRIFFIVTFYKLYFWWNISGMFLSFKYEIDKKKKKFIK